MKLKHRVTKLVIIVASAAIFIAIRGYMNRPPFATHFTLIGPNYFAAWHTPTPYDISQDQRAYVDRKMGVILVVLQSEHTSSWVPVSVHGNQLNLSSRIDQSQIQVQWKGNEIIFVDLEGRAKYIELTADEAAIFNVKDRYSLDELIALMVKKNVIDPARAYPPRP